jgi:RimJ/RimL family protein N-acetyltransferase
MEQSTEPRYFPKLVGERCYLSPMSEEDAPQYATWLNDLEIASYLTMAVQAIALPGEREYLRAHGSDHSYAVVTRDGDRLIGNVGLININHLERTCEIGVFIGAKDLWGQGYGREAMTLLMRYAFDYLNMRNIWLRAFAFNERAIASYRKLGFREIGRRRKAVPREESNTTSCSWISSTRSFPGRSNVGDVDRPRRSRAPHTRSITRNPRDA